MSLTALIPLAASLFSGFMGSKSSKRATQAQEQSTAAQIQAQKESEARYYAEQARVRKLLMPYVNSGYEAMGYAPGEIAAINNDFKRQVVQNTPSEYAPSQSQSPIEAALQETYPSSASPAEAFSGGPRPQVRFDPHLGSSAMQLSYARDYLNASGGNIASVPQKFQDVARQIQAQDTWDARYNEFNNRQNASNNKIQAPQLTQTPDGSVVNDVRREKPNFNGTVQNAQGTVVDGYNPATGNSSVNLKNFQAGYGRANPMLDTILNAGVREMPRLSSYAETGYKANKMQEDLSGLNGAEAQQNAYNIVESDPGYTYQLQKAEDAMLRNASATGGLRGGNVQGALAQFSPEFLSRAINQKYSQLAPLSNRGANISQYITGTGGNTAQNLYGSSQNVTNDIARMGLSAINGQPMGQPGTTPVSNMLAQQGAVQAGGELAQGNAWANALNNGVSNFFTAKKMGMFNSPPPQTTPQVYAPQGGNGAPFIAQNHAPYQTNYDVPNGQTYGPNTGSNALQMNIVDNF